MNKSIFTILLSGVAMVCLFLPAKAEAAPPVELGIFLPSAPWNISILQSFETNLGLKFNSVKWYQDWTTAFDSSAANTIHAHGAIPELVWQPQLNGAGIPNVDVVAGKHDAYIASAANAVKQLGYPVRITLAPEMNGDWCTWGVFQNGNTNETYKAFFRHTVTKFNEAGATNVQWVWAPNIQLHNKKYSYAELYPGDAYVSAMALDGYNWGTSRSWSVWQSFSEVFASSYDELARVSSKDIYLSETSSTELGGDKAQWITDMFTNLPTRFPRIKEISWFNINKETDWRIESSESSRLAFINGAKGITSTVVIAPSPSPAPTVSPTPAVSPTASPTPDLTKKKRRNLKLAVQTVQAAELTETTSPSSPVAELTEELVEPVIASATTEALVSQKESAWQRFKRQAHTLFAMIIGKLS